MIDESEVDESRALWQSQSSPPLRVSTELMRTRITKIDALMSRAKFAVILGGTLAFPACGWLVYTFPNALQRIGGVIVLIAVALQIRQVLGLVESTQAATGTVIVKPSVVAYRAVAERQRQFYSGPGAWARLLTFSVGPLIFLTGAAQVDGWDREMVVFAALCVTLPLGVFINGRLRAGRYQVEIDEIDRLELEEL